MGKVCEFSSRTRREDWPSGWSFQTVRRDLWDYDVTSQPVLVDLPTENGLTPALIQPTKQGELLVLDRRDGKPLAQVIDKAVPQTDVASEWTSKTQPFSAGMPSLSGQRLSETDMWGLSPFDQLWCRLRFRQLRYDGIFTPPSLTGSSLSQDRRSDGHPAEAF